MRHRATPVTESALLGVAKGVLEAEESGVRQGGRHSRRLVVVLLCHVEDKGWRRRGGERRRGERRARWGVQRAW